MSEGAVGAGGEGGAGGGEAGVGERVVDVFGQGPCGVVPRLVRSPAYKGAVAERGCSFAYCAAAVCTWSNGQLLLLLLPLSSLLCPLAAGTCCCITQEALRGLWPVPLGKAAVSLIAP